MQSRLLSVFLITLFVTISFAQEKNKFNPYSQPKKWKKEEARLQKLKEDKKDGQKIWELDYGEYRIYKSDGAVARFESNTSKRTPKKFTALTGNRKGNSPSKEDIFITYRGTCGQQIMLETSQLFQHNPLLQTFIKTRKLEDIPIKSMLNAMVKGLKTECDELESVRIKIGPLYLPRTEATGKDELITLQANMSKASNWTLKEGFGESLDALVIKFNTGTYLNTYLAVKYEGPCKTVQKLKIEPVFSNNTERYAYRKPTGLLYYENLAKLAIKDFILECPDVESFEFSLPEDIPDSVFRREGTKGVIKANKNNNWELDMSDFGYYSAEAPRINSYSDMITQLETNEFPFFDRYEDFFKLFYEDFMDVYGTTCRSNLNNVTKISIHAFESRYNSEGYKVSETSLGDPQVSFIETKYLRTYKTFSAHNKKTVLYNIFKAYITGKSQNNIEPVRQAILFRLEGSQQIKKYINSNCSDPKLKTLYNYIQELAKTN
ncbi:hypothetical protein [Algibacter sp. R77976]|uniref:hypothetical protein n=1 Tax=Algibacter sp. R77976 TaxID=3093873 RepID=UPI0037C5B299